MGEQHQGSGRPRPLQGNIVTLRDTHGPDGVNRHIGDTRTSQPHPRESGADTTAGKRRSTSAEAAKGGLNRDLKRIFDTVTESELFNFAGARLRIPSQLNIEAWRRELVGYGDGRIVDFLAYGWPINFARGAPLQSTPGNHATARAYGEDVDHYVATELAHGALAGPFAGPPTNNTHISPLMTREKKDSPHRRIIMDLSWPPGAAINDGVNGDWYIDGPIDVRLPTVEYMEQRVLALGRGAYMYKTDLARGYRQLRVDPHDWPLLGFSHREAIYLDICPPFGLKTSSMFMQRTSEAICYLHGRRGYYTRAYLDDFGGAELEEEKANRALDALQSIMAELGVVEAAHKVCRPARVMVWLGIIFDSLNMTMAIPQPKMEEIMGVLAQWHGRVRATQRELQSLLGLLQFVASVSPPTRVFTNRMLQNLRDTPKRGSETLSLGFKRDLKFFRRLLPEFNGIRILDKREVECQNQLELDACLTGCGAFTGTEFYAEQWPPDVLMAKHPIAHLELLNVSVATKMWGDQWGGRRVRVLCDNTNACDAITTGRSRDPFIQDCVRELFFTCAKNDIEILAQHQPGRLMVRADALSREHTAKNYADWVKNDAALAQAARRKVPPELFRIDNDM